MRNEEILNNIGTKETFIFAIRKKKLKHNEVIGLKVFNTHMTQLRQEKQGETLNKLPIEFVWMDGKF